MTTLNEILSMMSRIDPSFCYEEEGPEIGDVISGETGTETEQEPEKDPALYNRPAPEKEDDFDKNLNRTLNNVPDKHPYIDKAEKTDDEEDDVVRKYKETPKLVDALVQYGYMAENEAENIYTDAQYFGRAKMFLDACMADRKTARYFATLGQANRIDFSHSLISTFWKLSKSAGAKVTEIGKRAKMLKEAFDFSPDDIPVMFDDYENEKVLRAYCFVCSGWKNKYAPRLRSLLFGNEGFSYADADWDDTLWNTRHSEAESYNLMWEKITEVFGRMSPQHVESFLGEVMTTAPNIIMKNRPATLYEMFEQLLVSMRKKTSNRSMNKSGWENMNIGETIQNAFIIMKQVAARQDASRLPLTFTDLVTNVPFSVWSEKVDADIPIPGTSLQVLTADGDSRDFGVMDYFSNMVKDSKSKNKEETEVFDHLDRIIGKNVPLKLDGRAIPIQNILVDNQPITWTRGINGKDVREGGLATNSGTGPLPEFVDLIGEKSIDIGEMKLLIYLEYQGAMHYVAGKHLASGLRNEFRDEVRYGRGVTRREAYERRIKELQRQYGQAYNDLVASMTDEKDLLGAKQRIINSMYETIDRKYNEILERRGYTGLNENGEAVNGEGRLIVDEDGIPVCVAQKSDPRMYLKHNSAERWKLEVDFVTRMADDVAKRDTLQRAGWYTMEVYDKGVDSIPGVERGYLRNLVKDIPFMSDANPKSPSQLGKETRPLSLFEMVVNEAFYLHMSDNPKTQYQRFVEIPWGTKAEKRRVTDTLIEWLGERVSQANQQGRVKIK